MKELTHKEVCSKGGKNSWKGKSRKERYEIIKARWAKGRALNPKITVTKQTKSDVNIVKDRLI